VQELSSLDFHPDHKSAAVQQQSRPATESGPISVGSFDVTHGAKGNGCFPAASQHIIASIMSKLISTLRLIAVK